MNNHEVTFGYDQSRLVLQCWRGALDQVEETFAARCDMSAVLDVIRGPEAFRGSVVAFVEERFKRFQDKSLVTRLGCLIPGILFRMLLLAKNL